MSQKQKASESEQSIRMSDHVSAFAGKPLTTLRYIDIEVLWFDHVRSIPISSALFGSPGASLTEEISNDWDDWASGFGIS